jgi:Gpi18-like mannosyltransferase
MLTSIQKTTAFLQYSISIRARRYLFAFTALILRLLLLPQVSLDLYTYIEWYNKIVALGGFSALATSFSGYTPSYEYLLYLATRMSFLPSFISIKLISIAVDFIGAFVVMQLVRLKYPTGTHGYAAFFLTLFAPTVFINGAYWGQSDIIYTTCLLGFLYFILKDRPFYAMLCFSLGFAFKSQSVIISPFILMLIFKRKIPWYYLLLVPAMYALMTVPVLLVGRPVGELISLYSRQAESFRALSMNAPNPYIFIPNDFYDLVVPIGIVGSTLLALAYSIFSARSKTPLSAERLVMEATAVLFLMPFILPKMHDRYFYPAALFAIVLAFYIPRYRLMPAILQASSVLSYLPFLKMYPRIVVQAGAVFNILLMAWIAWEWTRTLFPRQEAAEQVITASS